MSENLSMAAEGLEPPIEISGSYTELYEIWSGQTTFRKDDKEIPGHGKVLLDFLPVPKFRFEFNPDEKLSFKDLFGPGVLKCGPLIGSVNCQVTQVGEGYFGDIKGQASSNALPSSIASAVYLVINGPHLGGRAIQRSNIGFTGRGRVTAKIERVEVTVDRWSSENQERRCIYGSTHVVRCIFSKGAATPEKMETVSTNLFRSLSLMKCRWVGLLGPWLYDSDGKEIGLRLSITKTLPNGGAISWYDESMGDCFTKLFPAMHTAFTDENRSNALLTALHWLMEAEQCAGGVEGALILQQAALECLAWLEVVSERQLCSKSGFKSLPASDKIRWLLSLYQIEVAIPDNADAITSYANAENLTDLIDVLTSVRNALVHAEPKMASRLLTRNKGEEEGSILWYQVGGILQQAFLASIGYKEKMVRRDVDSEFVVGAVRQVPWADLES